MSSSKAADIWKKACKHLQEVLHPDVYSRWIAVIGAAELAGDKLVLSVDNDFYQTWLEDNYLPLIQTAISAVVDDAIQPVFRVLPRSAASAAPTATSEPATAAEPAKPAAHARTSPKQQLNPKFTFDQFIIGPPNNFAHAASLAVAQAPGRAYNPLFIYGGTGLGKTHLMEAIGHHVQGTSRARICYTSSEAFLNEYIDALQGRALVN
ncbi:MAG: DnaA/Hda family protein, partial [Verrucomicrobia bacterium]|nr:DnaA/Hda family protein [Verrucomicrobiota bacterium]